MEDVNSGPVTLCIPHRFCSRCKETFRNSTVLRHVAKSHLTWLNIEYAADSAKYREFETRETVRRGCPQLKSILQTSQDLVRTGDDSDGKRAETVAKITRFPCNSA